MGPRAPGTFRCLWGSECPKDSLGPFRFPSQLLVVSFLQLPKLS